MITSTGTCPDCGAPLQLDQGGNCRWCHAHLRAGTPDDRVAGFQRFPQPADG